MRRAGGFTLIELITVIVILSIVSLISVRFVSLSVQGAIDTANRQRLAMTAGIINEKLRRDLRDAEDTDVGADDQCIEFDNKVDPGFATFCQGDEDEGEGRFLFRYSDTGPLDGNRPPPGSDRDVVATYLVHEDGKKLEFGLNGSTSVYFEFSLSISDSDETLGVIPGVVQVGP